MSFFPTAVVVGTDGSPQSRHALEAAVELCRATRSPLHLLHVKLIAGSLRGRPMTPQQRETTEAEGHALLDREAEAASELGLEVAGTHLRHGEQIEQTMTATTTELGAGLLVIGESATGRLPRLLTAGYSAATVRRSEGSVLVVR